MIPSLERYTPSKLLDHWKPPEEIILISLAIIIGGGTGLGAVFFIWFLSQISNIATLYQDWAGNVGGLLFSMVLAGLMVGYFVDRWAKEAKGHGVPEVMEAIALLGGRIRLSNERVRTLVACGAAAGIAATFNAPIAGSIFALEVILGRFTVRYFGTVVISSVVASVIGRIFLGDRPAFLVPAYPLNQLSELFLYAILGILSAFVAVAFIRVLYRTEEIFDTWKFPAPLKASLGLGLTGLIALLLPAREVLGPGLDLIGETIAEDFSRPLGWLAALLVLKLIATCLTLGSGNSGGVFAPSLFMGAVLGGIVGTIGHNLWPAVVVHPGAYAIVGMAAVFSGAARAPITAVLIVFEMSNDYRLILPLMMATVISTLLAENLFKESIYTLKLKLKGISLQGGRDVDVLQGVKVEEVMTANPAKIGLDTTLSELSEKFAKSSNHGFVVLDKRDDFWGLVTINDVRRALVEGMNPEQTIRDFGLARSKLAFAFPDETLGEALARMGIRGVGRLPVFDRSDDSRLVGLVRREDIIRGYRIAVARRAEIQHRTKQAELRNLDGIEFIDITLEPGFISVGKNLGTLSDALPQVCVIVSVRREDRLIIPYGDTILKAGDKITMFIKSEEIEQLRESLCAVAS